MKYSIASLIVVMQPEGKTLLTQSESYRIVTGCNADITINTDHDRLKKMQEQNPHLTADDCEYIYSGSVFYEKLPDFGGMLLHASAVALDGEAYLFSAKSGTGKSTHASLWLRYFGERAHIINDDKPALRITENKFKVFGTPWSGKTDLNKNESVPLKAIAFLERGTENRIKRLDTKEALPLLLSQTLRPSESIDNLTVLLDRLLTDVPFYKLACDMSVEAVKCSYGAMRK